MNARQSSPPGICSNGRADCGDGPGRNARPGTALVVTLVVIVMLSLGAYTFTELMVSESRAAASFARDAEARLLAESGVELAAAVLGTPDGTPDVLYHSPGVFGGLTLGDPTRGSGARCSVVAPVANDASGRLRYGLMDESAKWNLNELLEMDLEDDELTQLLLAAPGMTEPIAHAILDWLDDDNDIRAYGAELETYQSYSPPYAPKNGALESLDELLKVAGVTPQLLYGEDANRNGVLDPNENDGLLSQPADDEDGVLDLGWTEYFTIHSKERNIRADGSERINVNQSLLTELFDAAEPEIGTEMAKFLVAFRSFGPINPVSDGGQPTTGNATADEALKKLAEDIAKGTFKSDGSVTRAGVDLSKGGGTKFVSLYELIDAQVAAVVDGKETLLESPWTSDAGSLMGDFSFALDMLTLTDAKTINGRININQARREVLLGVPNLDPSVAETIVGSSLLGGDGAVLTDRLATQSTTAWLMAQGLVDQTTMVQLDKHLTARGDVHRLQAIGWFERGGPTARIEAVVDATQSPPRIISRRDLSSLGAGRRIEELMPGAAP